MGKPSLKVLEAEEDRDRDSLIRILSNMDHSVETVQEIKAEISKIKTSCKKFENSNKALAEWYLSNGSYNREKEVRSNRIQLIYVESRAAVRALNKKLHELCVEVESTIGNGSQAPGSCGFPSNDLLEDSTEKEDAHASQLHMHASEKTASEKTDNYSLACLPVPPVDSTVNPVVPSFALVSRRIEEAHIEEPPKTKNEGAIALPPVSHNDNLVDARFGRMSIPSHEKTCFSNGAVPKIRKRPLTSILRETPQVENVVERWIEDSDDYLNPSKRVEEPTEAKKETVVSAPKLIQRPELVNYSGRQRLDGSNRRHLKHELLRGLGDPFDGDPLKFWCWKTQITRKLEESEADPQESMYVLQANTKNRPRSLVTSRTQSGALDPDSALRDLWETLEERYGSSERVSNCIIEKVREFPNLKTCRNSFLLEDLLELCHLVLTSMRQCPDLYVFDLPSGTQVILDKLPDKFRSRWQTKCFTHREEHGALPKFREFVKFLGNYVSELNMPGFTQENVTVATRHVKVLASKSNETKECILHKVDGHTLENCSKFGSMSYLDKRQFMRDNVLCYKCLQLNHQARDCKVDVSCERCQRGHPTILHRENSDKFHNLKSNPNFLALPNQRSNTRDFNRSNKPSNINKDSRQLNSFCAQICHNEESVRICSKTLIVDLKIKHRPGSLRCLAILDDQSNCSLVDPKVLKHFRIEGDAITYKLTTTSGYQTKIEGNRIFDFQIRGITERSWIDLPPLRTNPYLPTCKKEVASPELVASHPHIRSYAKRFPSLDEDIEVLILVGADCGGAMGGRSYGSHHPYVYRSPLGWSLVGPACLERKHDEDTKCLKIACDFEHYVAKNDFPQSVTDITRGLEVFREYPDDEELGHSKDEQQFLDLMRNEVKVTKTGHLQFPLPLLDGAVLPDNKRSVFMRSSNTLRRIQRDPAKLASCLEIIGDYIAKGQVEKVPRSQLYMESFYVPVFPIDQKNKIRMVFDSSARYNGTSLNDCLLQGPDENNRIVGVLTRFRLGVVGFAADVERMFHSFYVDPRHRDFMRFFWWDQNNPRNELVPYRSKVHVFGNKSSPAVATYGLRHTTKLVRNEENSKACDCIFNSFYVDDLLAAAKSADEAVEILTRCRSILGTFNLRLHKICSNCPEVLSRFPESELAEKANRIFLGDKSSMKTLGLEWCIISDSFIFKIIFPSNPYTKRGMLSTLNSPYDPLGMVSPVILGGKCLQREIIMESKQEKEGKIDWDEVLSETYLEKWRDWIKCASVPIVISIPRSFFSRNSIGTPRMELHVFCDSSVLAIGVVIYVRVVNQSGEVRVSFLYGNSKLCPKSATSMPRSELCAAVDAAACANYMTKEIRRPIHRTFYYSDSKVVLGYLRNTRDRFAKYVTARVDKILKTSNTSQWQYVESKMNPADAATRPMTPEQLKTSIWLTGPEFLKEEPLKKYDEDDLIGELPMTENSLKVLVSAVGEENDTLDGIVQRYSSWRRVKSVLSNVCKFTIRLLGRVRKTQADDTDFTQVVEELIIKHAQKSCFPEALSALKRGQPLKESHCFSSLCPFLDENEIVRVGGRLKNSQLDFSSKHPILLPKRHEVISLVVNHCHEGTFHQGKHITSGALQQAGFHVHSGCKVIKEMLSRCVICRKLRGPLQTQIMADLPADRLLNGAPFTNVGFDVFGPYHVYEGKSTRRNSATKKIYGLLFTCLTSRAIHIEPLSALDISSFKLAFRRFISLRGPCKRLRSDRGTNFVGARNQILRDIGPDNLKQACADLDCVWQLNTPGASHAAGIWERKIGAFKRVFGGAMKQLNRRHLSRDELHTLFSECAAIVNMTPLYLPSNDPNDPIAISPQMLLTLKTGEDFSATDLSPTDLQQYGAKRWKRVSYLAEQFWVRHKRQYLKSLQERSKWRYSKRSLRTGDLVLLKTSSGRGEWPIARIVSARQSEDGHVRSVTLEMVDANSGRVKKLERCVQDTVLLIPCPASEDPSGGNVVE